MKSSKLFKKSKLNIEDFNGIITSLTKDGIIKREVNPQKLKGTQKSSKEVIEIDAHSYCITDKGTKMLKRDFKIPTILAIIGISIAIYFGITSQF